MMNEQSEKKIQQFCPRFNISIGRMTKKRKKLPYTVQTLVSNKSHPLSSTIQSIFGDSLIFVWIHQPFLLFTSTQTTHKSTLYVCIFVCSGKTAVATEVTTAHIHKSNLTATISVHTYRLHNV